MGGGEQTSTSSTELPPHIVAAQKENINIGNVLGNRPYVPYTEQRIAEFTPDQESGFSLARVMAGGPQLGMGHGVASGVAQFQPSMVSAGQLKDTDLSVYMNPYISNVVDTSLNDLDRANQMALRSVQSQASTQGAYGGARMGLAQAETNRGMLDAAARTAAGLRYQGYNDATQNAFRDIDNRMKADLSNQSAGLQGAQLRLGAAGQMAQSALARQQRDSNNVNLLLGIGGQQQQMDQSNVDLAYQDFLRQFQYPIDMLNLRQSMLQGPTGSTTTSTGPGQDSTGQLLGSAMMAAAVAFSDRRLKTDITPAGTGSHDLPVYRFRYLWDAADAPLRTGFMADEVERVMPDAVFEVSGFKAVDYGMVLNSEEA
ncbi:MAG TPA: tail fiber domain-containing protein [Azospirillum sp.]|nr:tail fiber domain-containing protein [Azospirillum sp.]